MEHYDAHNSLRARALIIYSLCIDDFAKCQIITEQSLQLARTLSDKQAEALGLSNLGVVLSLQGNLREGIPFVEQSLVLYQALGDKLGQANAKSRLSLSNNDLEYSKALVDEALRLYRELGHLSGIAACLNYLAYRMIWGGDFSSPAQLLEEARGIFLQLGDQAEEASVLQSYAILAYWKGDYSQACIYCEEAILLEEKVGNYLEIPWCHVHLSYALLRQGDLPKAKATFKLCIQGFRKQNSMLGLIYAIEGLASLYLIQGQLQHAMKLFAWTDIMREKIYDYRPPVEQASVERDLAVIRSNLNDTTLEMARTEGEAFTMEQAIELALDDKQ